GPHADREGGAGNHPARRPKRDRRDGQAGRGDRGRTQPRALPDRRRQLEKLDAGRLGRAKGPVGQAGRIARQRQLGGNRQAALAGGLSAVGVCYRRLKRRALVPLLLLALSAACSAPLSGPTGASPVAARAASPTPKPTPTPTPTPAALSLTSIFGDSKPDLAQYDQSQLRVIIATGDVIPAREVNYQTVLKKDWAYPWRQTADYLKTGDLLYINLESPLIKACPIIHGGFKFCGDARAIAGLDYAGADLVIGNHPHWVQPVEIYNGHLITYAHGNFIFDQMWSQETREGMVGRYTFYGTRLVRVDYRPLVIDNYAQPRWLDDTTGEGKAIIDRVAKASQQLAAG